MKPQKNTLAKIMAGIALFAIILSILSSAILIIFSGSGSSNDEISEEELKEMIESLSGTTLENK